MLAKTQPDDIALQLQRLEPLIGHTPVYPITRAYDTGNVQILAKLEWMQLGGSVKARPAFNIVKQAMNNGSLDGRRRILDASSGNTAIAYASIGAALGIGVSVCLPENASEERKILLRSLGAEIIPSSRFGTTDEAQELAATLHAKYPERYFYADQYGNAANWQAHYHTTAVEIFDRTGLALTHFVAGLGTTGTFVGTGRRLKELNPEIRLVALQPDTALHGLEGWKHLETARVPGIFDATLADHTDFIDSAEAYRVMRRVAEREGLLISPSAAANLAGAVRLAETLEEGVIVTVFPDNADKYGEVLEAVFS